MTLGSYAVVTPIRNEVAHLRNLLESLLEQTAPPTVWVIVDNGSDDETPTLAAALAEEHEWIRFVSAPLPAAAERAGPIVHAFEAGIAAITPDVDALAKVDADVTLPPDYFERLLSELAADPRIGMLSGSGYEQEDGVWVERGVTGDHVWGAARLYRRGCLDQLLPFERRTGWDGMDVLEANVRGWKTGLVAELPFFHHRREGSRAPSRRAQWTAQGRAAHYMGYRAPYLIGRALYRARRDPSALAMIASFVGASARREPTVERAGLREFVREQQRLRRLLPLAASKLRGRQRT